MASESNSKNGAEGNATIVGIALGSNLGDRGNLIAQGFDFVRSLSEPLTSGEAVHFKASPVFLTEPVDCPPGSPPFLNAVAEIATFLTPEDLLSRLQSFERHLGRPEVRPVNSPRPLDLDVLYYGTSEIKTERLVVPHPRMAQRLFVLVPLAVIRPELVLPAQKRSVRELRDSLLAETTAELHPKPVDHKP